EVAGIGHLHEQEAAAQTGDVDPLLVVVGRVTVRPPNRSAEHHPARSTVLAAGPVDGIAGRARDSRYAHQVAQAIDLLDAPAHQLLPAAAAVQRPELKLRGVLEL